MSVITVFFGECGAGKSYRGMRFAKQNNVPFFEGDLAIPKSMREWCERGLPPSRKMVKDFVLKDLAKAILERAADTDLVVSQALYNDQDRKDLFDILTRNGHTVHPFWVKVPTIQHIKQLWSRDSGLKWIIFWLMNTPFFQKPTHISYPA